MNRRGYLLSLYGCVKKKLYLFSYYLHIYFSPVIINIYEKIYFINNNHFLRISFL